MGAAKLTHIAVNGARVGDRVQVGGSSEWRGVLEYVTVDGWAGIRQGGHLDEVQAERVSLLAVQRTARKAVRV